MRWEAKAKQHRRGGSPHLLSPAWGSPCCQHSCSSSCHAACSCSEARAECSATPESASSSCRSPVSLSLKAARPRHGLRSVLTSPFTPPESGFRPDTRCRGPALHRLLQLLPQSTALFSTTDPLYHSRLSYFGQTLADASLKNLRWLPLTTE